MGMHFGLVAVQVPLQEFRTAFSEVWPQLEVAASADSFSDAEAIWCWKSANERSVPAAQWTKEDPGSEVYVLCQDGPWAVLMDFSYVLAGDEKALEQLSRRFGTVLSFIVETAGGCAYFWCYQSGQLRRMIQNIDGEVTSSGESLPEESGIDVGKYYMDQTEELMRAFALSAVEQLPVVSTAVAVSTIDRTDFAHVAAAVGAGKSNGEATSTHTAKPWWKFW